MFIIKILPYVIYPLMTSAGVVFGLWAIDQQWPAWLVGVVAIIVATLLVEILEHIVPYSHSWQLPHNDRLTDFFHLLFSNRAFDIGTIIAIGLCAPVAVWVNSRLGYSLWPHHWPILLQTLLAIVVFELPWYWVHRLGHSWNVLWRVHSVHHSSQRIYWWNFARNHPFDNLLSAFVAFVPLTIMGVGQEPLAVMAAFSAAHGLLQHSNIDLRTGPLDLLFSTAQVHRWHHSPERQERDTNFSPRLMLWDHVFGTYRYRPNKTPREDVGLGTGHADYPVSFVKQMLIPFRSKYWRQYD